MSQHDPPKHPARIWIAHAFSAVEDLVYVGLGLLLGFSAIALLAAGAFRIVQGTTTGTFPSQTIIETLDRILLILLIVELLYTVQVSFRERAILPEPFLLVGLIAAVRRVLVLTAEYGERSGHPTITLDDFVIELLVLTALILALVFSLVLLRRSSGARTVERD